MADETRRRNRYEDDGHGFCPYCMNRVKAGDVCPVCGLTMGGYVPSPHHLPPGTILSGRYLIGRVLGEGGFGITYIGCDLRLEMKVAVKEYFPADRVSRRTDRSMSVVRHTTADTREYEKGVKKFLYEARIMARMEKQPQIVMVRDYFEANGTAYIVMEYVDGTTLAELVKQQGGRIGVEELLSMLEPLFGALSTVHKASLLHRDISPDNLMLEKGKIRLLDLGCARETSEGAETMTVALKQGYGPIEQYQGRGQGPWTDVYALSATIYYCLTGRKPPQALDRTLEDELVPPRKLGVDIRPDQEKALLQGLAVNPARRTRTIEELYGGLYAEPPEPEPKLPEPEPELPGPEAPEPEPELPGPEAPEPETNPAKPGRRVGLGVLGAVLAVALLAVFLVSRGKEDIIEPSTAGDGTKTAVNTAAEDASVFDGAATLNGGTLEELRELLASDEVTSVVLTESYFSILEGELEITKPLFIAEGAGFDTYQPVTVSGDGYLEIQGGVYSEGVIRVCEGGGISVTGELSSNGSLWLEHEEDLTIEDGGILRLNGGEYASVAEARDGAGEMVLVLSVEDVFADAVHVTSRTEYERAVERGTASAIVIDADLYLSDSMEFTLPTMISEGVTVTAPHAEESETSVQVVSRGTDIVLVNRGTLAGDFQTCQYGDGTTAFVLNYGTMDLDLVSLTCPGQLLNYGEMNIGGQTVNGTDLYNLGTVVCTGREDCDSLELFAGHNYGTWVFEAADGLTLEVRSQQFYNNGTLTIGAGVSFGNFGFMRNNGTLALTDATAKLGNAGRIESISETSVLTAVEGAEWDNPYNGRGSGVLLYSQNSDADFAGASGFLRFSWIENDTAWVSSAEELLSAVQSDQYHDIVIAEGSSVRVSENVELNGKVLVLHQGASLTVEGDAGLTVSTEEETGGLILCVGSRLDLETGSLTLREGTSALTEEEATLSCGELILEENARMLLSESELKDMSVVLSGAHLTNQGNVSLYDCEIQLMSDGYWWLDGDEAGFYGCTVEIEDGCHIMNGGDRAGVAHFTMDEDTSVTVEDGGELQVGDSDDIAGSVEYR